MLDMLTGAALRSGLIFVAAALLFPSSPLAQSGTYDQLVVQAQADLKSGNSAQALAESQKPIAAAPSRWEAYVVAGGALQTEQQYDRAFDDFTKALEHAPEAKRPRSRACWRSA